MNMTRGFITIATGKEQYFELALNLLHSYRHFSAEPLPFAIIADRENEYTAEFDDVRIFENPTCSYLDKLEMFNYLPYDINIFVDADCLAYGDMNRLFQLFEDADDFSCFGRALPVYDKTGWFEYEDLGELQSKVDYVVGLHGGIYYMRKTDITRNVFEISKELAKDYSKYNFKGKFSTPGDEPLIALSMAINKCRPIQRDKTALVCFWEYKNGIKMNARTGKAYVKSLNNNTSIVHWGTRFTSMPIYRKQTAAIDILRKGESRMKLCLSNLKFNIMIVCERMANFIAQCKNKLGVKK